MHTSPPAQIGRLRWGICALLFFATTINYVDRAVLGILAPTLRGEIGWTDGDYGRISAAFTLAYAIGFLFAGWFIDRVGTRIGYAAYLTVWSLAAAWLLAEAAPWCASRRSRTDSPNPATAPTRSSVEPSSATMIRTRLFDGS